MEREAVVHQLLAQDEVFENVVAAKAHTCQRVASYAVRSLWRVAYVASWEAFISTARATLGPAPRNRLPAPSSRTIRNTPSKLRSDRGPHQHPTPLNSAAGRAAVACVTATATPPLTSACS